MNELRALEHAAGDGREGATFLHTAGSDSPGSSTPLKYLEELQASRSADDRSSAGKVLCRGAPGSGAAPGMQL